MRAGTSNASFTSRVNLWHLTPDAPRTPRGPPADRSLDLVIGTWPVEPAQSVRVEFRATTAAGLVRSGRATASWRENRAANSYWTAVLGPLGAGERLEYWLVGTAPGGEVRAGPFMYQSQPSLQLAILWHHHQEECCLLGEQTVRVEPPRAAHPRGHHARPTGKEATP